MHVLSDRFAVGLKCRLTAFGDNMTTQNKSIWLLFFTATIYFNECIGLWDMTISKQNSYEPHSITGSDGKFTKPQLLWLCIANKITTSYHFNGSFREKQKWITQFSNLEKKKNRNSIQFNYKPEKLAETNELSLSLVISIRWVHLNWWICFSLGITNFKIEQT